MQKLEECSKPGSSGQTSTQQSLPETVVTIPSAVIADIELTIRQVGSAAVTCVYTKLQQQFGVRIKEVGIPHSITLSWPPEQKQWVSLTTRMSGLVPMATLALSLTIAGRNCFMSVPIVLDTHINGEDPMLHGLKTYSWPLSIQ